MQDDVLITRLLDIPQVILSWLLYEDWMTFCKNVVLILYFIRDTYIPTHQMDSQWFHVCQIWWNKNYKDLERVYKHVFQTFVACGCAEDMFWYEPS